MAEPLQEAAQQLVLAIFRLAVCDLSGLSYNHEAEESRPLRHRRHAPDALLFLSGDWARELGDLACIPMDAVVQEARRLAIGALANPPADNRYRGGRMPKRKSLRPKDQLAADREAIARPEHMPGADATRRALAGHIATRRSDTAFHGRLRKSIEHNQEILGRLATD